MTERRGDAETRRRGDAVEEDAVTERRGDAVKEDAGTERRGDAATRYLPFTASARLSFTASSSTASLFHRVFFHRVFFSRPIRTESRFRGS